MPLVVYKQLMFELTHFDILTRKQKNVYDIAL